MGSTAHKKDLPHIVMEGEKMTFFLPGLKTASFSLVFKAGGGSRTQKFPSILFPTFEGGRGFSEVGTIFLHTEDSCLNIFQLVELASSVDCVKIMS